MRILITSGGTIEKIDEVRNIRNASTGRLSQLIADDISLVHDIDYVYGSGSLLPSREVNLYPIESVSDLDFIINKLMHQYQYDVVIHAMAVSDYMIQSVTTYETMAEKLKNNNLLDGLNNYPEDLERSKKIRSNYDNLAVLMKKSPKIISKIKSYQKNTVLVGFKLLTNVDEAILVETGHQLLKDNDADYVLANDLIYIKGDKHKGHFIHKDKTYETFETKQEIAKNITERLELR